MENKLVAGVQERWKKGGGMTINGQNKTDLCGDASVLYLEYGGGYTNLHMIKGQEYTRTHALDKCRSPGFNSYYSFEGCNHGVKGTWLYYLCNFLQMYNYSKIKGFTKEYKF